MLKIWKTHAAVQLPKRQTSQSACFDLAFQSAGKREFKGYSHMNKPFTRQLRDRLTVAPGERALIPTGCIMDIPEGFSVRLHARSGTSLKQGLVLANAEGVIDSDYVEEVFVILHNISGNAVTIENGDRIAQAELIRDLDYSIEETAARPGVKTTRVGGMGSTGVTDNGNTITLNISEPKIPEFVKNNAKIETAKRGRGRPKKTA